MKRTDETLQKKSGRVGLRRDVKGAVLAEFVVAFLPLMTVFFVFVQLSTIAIASLMVKHSAVVGARAAAVFSNQHDNVPEACGDNGQGKIDEAVKAALGPWQKYFAATGVQVTDTSSRAKDDGPYDLVTVKVTAVYRCQVPLGKMICPGGVKPIIDTKSMPHQGARYKSANCSGGF